MAERPHKERQMELSTIPIEMPDGLNVIVGQAHFIKTVEDLHEALAGANPYLRFGLAFCEASGPCLIRCSGNAQDLEVCTVYCATANPVEVLVAQTDLGRGIVGVVDGMPPAGIETPSDEADRKHLLRQIGYKL